MSYITGSNGMTASICIIVRRCARVACDTVILILITFLQDEVKNKMKINENIIALAIL